MGMLDRRLVYKDENQQFEYEEPYNFFEFQNNVHWMWSEVPMGPDVQDWELNLSAGEKNVVGNILKSFAQTEVMVNDYWRNKVGMWFPKPEIGMMAAAFSNMEAIHTKAYAYLNETLELEDYTAFLEDKASADKIERLNADVAEDVKILTDVMLNGSDCDVETKKHIARSLAIFSAFTEGVQLFSSFAVLLSFKKSNKLKKIGNIVEWSVRDESLHSNAGCQLFRRFIAEYPEVFDDDLKGSVYQAARDTVALEDAFIDKIFELGPIDWVTPEDLKQFIRHRANNKLGQLGLKKNWKNVDKDAILRMQWFDNMTGGDQSTDFFDGRVTNYSKGNIDWNGAFEFNMPNFLKEFGGKL